MSRAFTRNEMMDSCFKFSWLFPWGLDSKISGRENRLNMLSNWCLGLLFLSLVLGWWGPVMGSPLLNLNLTNSTSVYFFHLSFLHLPYYLSVLSVWLTLLLPFAFFISPYLLSPGISFTLLFAQPLSWSPSHGEERWRGLASGFSSKPSLPVGEGSERKKRRGTETELQRSLSDSCVCLRVCGYCRACWESRGKCGSSACVFLNYLRACRPLTQTWRRFRMSWGNNGW